MTNRVVDQSTEPLLPTETGATAVETAVDERDETTEEAAFPIVGVGASAGGLEAFTQLLKALPSDTGMAFVLVQHLAPTHASALAEILSRATKMSVTEVRDQSPVEPNHVYVIPPDRSMVIALGALQLLPREGQGIHRPVDQFFRSLAEDRRHQAIGVVLSGTASDGTLGLEAIKAEGGITFAQDATAQHEGMPHSAIASGCVDFVLPPDEIAREIVRIGQHPYAVPEAVARETDDKPNLAEVVKVLHHATGVDFTHYKFNTLYRRVTRRMVFQKMNSLTEYVKYLRQTPAEVDALYQDILISVTSFFRDPASFEALKTTVFPRLLKDRSRHDPVRLWTLGCSTGQEAYSLAMVFTEVAEAAGSTVPFQLFATDLNPVGIEKARAGIYSKDVAQDVSPERLRRFFTEVDGGYRISKTIRDACIFSRHNVLADPPFSRIDMISCRNLLIYLEPVLQQRIVPTLHYALKPEGCLWLGGSETIGGYRNLFEAEDAKHKIYAKKPGSSREHGHFPLQSDGAPRAPFIPITARPSDATDLPREADRVLLTKFAPPGVLVSAELDILQYRGDTGPYLSPAPGKASLNLLKMLREGLLVAVRAAILRAGKEEATVREAGLRVKSNGGYRDIAIEVIPIKGPGVKQAGFLVLFEEKSGEGRVTSGEQDDSASLATHHSSLATASLITRLEQELAATREYLQSVIEQQEAANEELQSANEEVQSANEELQSTNEELETSKEEIQSSNEELATVNDELNNRNAELHRVNDDLLNLLGSIQSAIVMLGPDLRVRRFTPSAEKLLNLISTDVGRPLTDIKLNLDHVPDLEPLLMQVLDTVAPQEFDVRDKHGRWYSLRLRPYRTLNNKIDGVVVMLVDVDVIKRAHEYTHSIVATVREPLLVLDQDLRVQSASRSFYETFRAVPADTVNRHLYELGNGQWDIPDLRRLLNEVLPRDNQVTDFEMEYEFEQIGRKTMRLNARRLIQAADQAPLILLAIEDVTESEAVQKAVRESERRYRESDAFNRSILENSPDCVKALDATGRLMDMNANGQCLMEIDDFATVEGRLWCDLWPQEGQAEVLTAIEAARAGGTGKFQNCCPTAKGTPKWWDVLVAPIHDAEGEVIRFVSVSRDITERRQAEQALRESQSRLGYAVNAARLTYVEVDFARGGARTAENFAAVMGYASPPEQEADVSVGTRLLLEHVVPQDRPSVEAALQDFLGGKIVGKIEYRVLGDDQIERWIESAWSIEFDPSGQPLKTFATNLDITERKRATEALRESEERYRNLFNSIDEGFCLMEMLFDEHDKPVDYRFLEVNPSFEQQCGLHNATGKRIREFYPNLEDYWFELYGQVALTGEPVRYVNEAKTMEGRWFDVYAFRVGGRDSRKVAVLFNDVKQRKEAEAALRESEERYRNLFNSIDEGFCVIEMIFDEHEQPIDYRFLEVNPVFEKQTGLHDAVGKRIRELRPNLETHWFEIYGQVARTGETIRFVNEAKTMEGRWFDVYALRVGAPESRKVAVVFNDITERRQSEEALRHSEQRLRFVMDSMPQKIFTALPDGDLDYFNPQWTEFTGLSFEQMQDSGWTRFVHPDDVDEKTRLWRHAFGTGEPFQSEHRFRRADGEYRWHFSRAVPMRDEAGQITMWVGSNTDVHDLKLVEAKLQKQAAELSDLHHRKDEFLAMLSHELRSPLAPIANAVQLLSLQQGSESRIQQQARSIIERQLGQLQHLVNDLLEVSRITTGRVQLRRERVVISGIVHGAVETARPLLEQRRHELTVSLPPEPIWLMADAARLEQVLVNLLNNAAKYTEAGGHVWVTVELVSGTALAAGGSPETSTARHAMTPAASAVPLTGSEVVIRVRDNGIGIDPALLPRIFDLFTQAERSLDRSQGGLGIGLALVQRLTELHGGTVEAHSTLGQGSEFVVRIPLEATDSLNAALLPKEIGPPTIRPLRVLVVDDNVDTVLSFSMLLEAHGHKVRTAHNGLEAVQTALEYQPDIMLLDIGLPGLNGYQVAKRIRQEPALKNIVLVALTGYGQDSDRQISLQAGFNHHLVKPAVLEQLLQILATVVERKT